MGFFRGDLLALGLGVCLLTPVGVRTEQPTATEKLVRSQLTLAARPVTVSFSPTLSADASPHRQLLASGGSTSEGQVRVAQLEGGALLRIGTIDGSALETPEEERPRRSQKYDLWLTRAGAVWTLEARAISDDDVAMPSDAVDTIPLSHGTTEVMEDFLAVLEPTSEDAGQLVL